MSIAVGRTSSGSLNVLGDRLLPARLFAPDAFFFAALFFPADDLATALRFAAVLFAAVFFVPPLFFRTGAFFFGLFPVLFFAPFRALFLAVPFLTDFLAFAADFLLAARFPGFARLDLPTALLLALAVNPSSRQPLSRDRQSPTATWIGWMSRMVPASVEAMVAAA
jgi:hypothetical protein